MDAIIALFFKLLLTALITILLDYLASIFAVYCAGYDKLTHNGKDFFWAIVDKGYGKFRMLYNNPVEMVIGGTREDLPLTTADEDDMRRAGVKIRYLGEENKWYILFFRGLVWVGIPPAQTTFSYPFVWTTQTGNEEVHNDMRLNVFRIQPTVYLFSLSKVESKRHGVAPGVAVELKIQVTCQIVNPYKTFFKNAHWLERLWAKIEADVLTVVGATDFTDLYGGKHSGVKIVDDETRAYILSEIGVLVVDAAITSVDPTDETLRARMQQAAMIEYDIEAAKNNKTLVALNSDIKEIEARGTAAGLDATLGKINQYGGERAVALSQIPRLGTYVEGTGGVPPVLPIGGDNKGGKE